MGKKESFEHSLEKLEKIVISLEQGEYPLEECLNKFQEGIEYYKKCKSFLEKAEKKIAVLNEELQEKDFD